MKAYVVSYWMGEIAPVEVEVLRRSEKQVKVVPSTATRFRSILEPKNVYDTWFEARDVARSRVREYLDGARKKVSDFESQLGKLLNMTEPK